uniref:RCC1-like domain-containing protein n=1 Tax=Neogobius melanostomus TaxID=47308 RepID=A0A8C6U8S7_9GOBI
MLLKIKIYCSQAFICLNVSRCCFSSPVPMPLPIPVIQVACGKSHSLALTQGKTLKMCAVVHGQLGLGKTIPLQFTPLVVRSLNGVAVSMISAGSNYSLFLTLPGPVYCCGANGEGQLGLDRVDKKGAKHTGNGMICNFLNLGRFNVCVVPALRNIGVSFISCGEAHTAVLTKCGQVWTFGDGSHGQLGHNSTANELKPRLVEGLDGLASQIACGRRHTLVLSASGRCWAFGDGVKGQMGNGQSESSLTPVEVQLAEVVSSGMTT